MTRRLIPLLLAVALAPLVYPAPATAAPDDQRCAAHRNRLDYVPWQITRLAPQRVWPVSRGRGITVAVLDSGVNSHHPQLTGRVLPGTDLVRGHGSADDDCSGHGSIVGGIIAAHDVTGTGFAGMAPDATLLPVRIATNLSRFDNGSPRIARAIRYAVDHHAGIVNMSLTTEDTPELRSAVHYAHAHDVVLVAAAGNEAASTDGPIYPAAYPEVIAVSGVDPQGAHVSSSNSGEWVDLAAPGEKIVGPAATTSGYSQGDGTSFAAPFVSGVAALIRAYRPKLSADQVRQRLEATADHPVGGRDDQVGYGVVNPYRAVTAVLDSGAPPPTARPGALPAAASTPPAAGHRTVLLLAGVGVLLSVALLLAVAVVPRGRRRHWRPGLRTAPTTEPAPPTSPDPGTGPARIMAPASTRAPHRGRQPAAGPPAVRSPATRTPATRGPATRPAGAKAPDRTGQGRADGFTVDVKFR